MSRFQRSKPITRISEEQKQMLLGDAFDSARPHWCFLIKLTQGLSDSLFQHKFHDWEMAPARMFSTPKRWKTTCLSPIASPQREEKDACNLGRYPFCIISLR
ncbi:unnamed protein product [Gongylonema pulchrum]|uniref:Transposase n=1 Tax=Gongylonema pulchrum TaxID=637853 RepID=A0A183EN25_9BILA|nr:unnamed protein product [Gongylonema pulchrum]